MYDSLAATPLSLISAKRVTNLYDLMDAAYCSAELRDHSRSLGHVPLIDHNPRRGEKIEFAPAEAIRYNERTAAERSNARLKDEFDGNTSGSRADKKLLNLDSSSKHFFTNWFLDNSNYIKCLRVNCPLCARSRLAASLRILAQAGR